MNRSIKGDYGGFVDRKYYVSDQNQLKIQQVFLNGG